MRSPTQDDGAPIWPTKLWLGGDFFALSRLLLRNRFAVHWSCLYAMLADYFFSLLNTVTGQAENLIYGRRVRRTVIRNPPLFIIGHWRTGTTLLHEMLIRDERHTYPTTYDCFAPCHFLLTARFLPDWLKFIMPTRRPMDNMPMAWDTPQEDEFALALLGAPSPYNAIAFPNQEAFELRDFTPKETELWQAKLLQLLRRLTLRDSRRLILKSPTHTTRIGILRSLFPDAKFVHIVRDPYRVFPSTMHLWKVLYKKHAYQEPDYRGLEEQVFRNYLYLHRRLEEDRTLIAPGNFHELRYEDLIANPVGEMAKLYEKLNLGNFDRYRPRLEEYLSGLSGYETNRYAVTPEEEAEITRRWGEVIERYGYAKPGFASPRRGRGNLVDLGRDLRAPIDFSAKVNEIASTPSEPRKPREKKHCLTSIHPLSTSTNFVPTPD